MPTVKPSKKDIVSFPLVTVCLSNLNKEQKPFNKVPTLNGFFRNIKDIYNFNLVINGFNLVILKKMTKLKMLKDLSCL